MKVERLFNLVNILLIVLIILWDTLQKAFLDGFDGRGRVVLILTAFLFLRNIFLNKRYQNLLFSRKSFFKFWTIWFVYAVINTVIKFSLKDLPIDSFIGVYLFTPFVIMSTIASIPFNYINDLLKWLGLAVYITFVIYFLTSNNLGGRLLIEKFDPNEFSLLIYLLLTLLGISFLLKTISKSQYLLLLILPVYFSIMLGSRMGFIGVLILLLGPSLVSFTKNKLVSFRKLFIIIGLSIVPLFYVMNNTILGERLQSTTENSEGTNKNYAEGTIFEKFGDRGLYYILGWEAFKNEPITGIGLRNFQDNYYPTVLHSEIMVQLAELGLIGFILYVIFNLFIFKAIRKSKKSLPLTPIYKYLYFVFGAIIIASSVLFLYQSIATAIIYGLLLLFTNTETTKRFTLK